MRADAPITDDELEKIAMELGIHNNLHDEGPDIKTQCKFCEKSFRNKRYMMEHYVRHHRAANQKLPHRCEVCGKGNLGPVEPGGQRGRSPPQYLENFTYFP